MPIIINVEAVINERRAQQTANQLADSFDKAGTIASEKFSSSWERGLAKQSPRIQRSFNAVENAIANVRKEQAAYDRLSANSKTTAEALERQHDRLAAAVRREGDAYRTVGESIKKHFSDRQAVMEKAYEKEKRAYEKAAKDLKGPLDSIQESIEGIGKHTFLVSRGLMTMAAPTIISGLFETAQALVTASQALALLPAAATAAGAGLLTLKLATAGFSDTLKNVHDMDKFAEGLANLAPNAQQAALAVRDLLPEFENLRKATSQEFFAGFAAKFEDLSATFAQPLRGLTTSIASSMNQATMGIADTLMTSDNEAKIQRLMDNISDAFRNAAPAAGEFANALVDIANVGSEFLPDLGQGITDAATKFANFIEEARESGQLEKWIQSGVNAVKGLTDVLGDVAKAVYDVFGNMSRQEIENWRDTVKDALTVFKGLMETLNTLIDGLNYKIPLIGQKFKDLANPIKQVTDIVDKIRWLTDPEWRKRHTPTGESTLVPELSTSRNPFGGAGAGATAGGDIGEIGRPDSRVPQTRGRIKEFEKITGVSDKDLRDRIIAGLDPSLWRVDPNAGMAAAAAMAGPMPAGGYGVVDAQKVLEQQRRVLSEAHDLEEARKERLARERDNVSTQREIDDAKWKEVEAGWRLQEAQVDLVKAQRGTTKEIEGAFEDLGIAIDRDFGISKGLGGIAENVVKFLAGMAAAPLLGKLAAQREANGGTRGGGGLIGMLGAQGVFGPRFAVTDDTTAATTGGATDGRLVMPSFANGGSASGSGTPPLAGAAAATGGSNLSAMLALAQRASGGKYKWGGTDLTNGLADCSGAISELVAVLTGRGAGGPRLFNAGPGTAEALQGLGFKMGFQPGAMNIGYRVGGPGGGHMAATLPNGVNFESGGGSGGIQYGGSAAGAKGFPHQFYLPVSDAATMTTGGPTSPSSTAGPAAFGGGNIPIPLPVTIVGGGVAAGGGGSFGTPLPATTGGGGGGSGARPPGGSFGTPLPQTTRTGGGGGRILTPEQLRDPALTNPGLNNPGGGGGGTGAGGGLFPGLTTPPSALGGSGAAFPGAPTGGPDTGPTLIGGSAFPAGPGGGSAGQGGGLLGGAIQTAAAAASMAINAQAPGAGAAAAIASDVMMKEAQRAIQYAGQVAGIGAEGLLETFLPTGASELAANSWLTRIVGGLAGMAPQLPNLAGGKKSGQGELTPQQQAQANPPGPLTPGQVAQNGINAAGAPTVNNNIGINNIGATPDQNGNAITHHLNAQYGANVPQPVGP